jgi:hypothetical protein
LTALSASGINSTVACNSSEADMMRTLLAASIALTLTPTLSFAAVEIDVVNECGTGSLTCADTAGTYVSDLAPTGRPSAIVDLTLALVAEAQKDPACNDVDRAAALAIRRIAAFADAAQAVRLDNIADALEHCDVTDTAAINPSRGNITAPSSLGSAAGDAAARFSNTPG